MLNVTELYDIFHAIPELGFQEFKTAATIEKILKDIGYTNITTGIGGTGVMAELKGNEPGPTVMVRADIDALPFVDKDGNPYTKHSCGHDGHIAMTLCVAEKLFGKIRKGALRVLFQPAEELGQGAKAMIAAGVIKDVDIILGMHNRPVTEIPDGSMTPAVLHGATTFVTVSIKGKEGHGARPHLGKNAIEAGVLFVQAINSIRLDPTKAWSCKVTKFNGGTVFNIVPEKAELMLDARCQTNEMMLDLFDKIKSVAAGIETITGCNIEIGTVNGLQPGADVDPEITKLINEVMHELLPDDKIYPPYTNPGGEDFHFYTQKYPNLKSGFFGLGAGAKPGLHAKDMELNKESLYLGVEVMSRVVMKLLG